MQTLLHYIMRSVVIW